MQHFSHIGWTSSIDGPDAGSWVKISPSTAQGINHIKPESNGSSSLSSGRFDKHQHRLKNSDMSEEVLTRLEVELDEVENALLFWTGALAHQKTASVRATARDEIVRLSAKAKELWRDIQELSGEPPIDEMGESEEC